MDITITATEKIEIREGQIIAEATIKEGCCVGGSLGGDTGNHFLPNSLLFFADLQEFKDIVSAAQELLKAVTERTE